MNGNLPMSNNPRSRMYELLGATPTKTTDNISHFISVPYIVATFQFSG